MFIFSMIIIFIVGIISSVVSMVVVVMQVRLAVYGNARGGHSCSASTVNRSSGESPWFGVRTVRVKTEVRLSLSLLFWPFPV